MSYGVLYNIINVLNEKGELIRGLKSIISCLVNKIFMNKLIIAIQALSLLFLIPSSVKSFDILKTVAVILLTVSLILNCIVEVKDGRKGKKN